MIIQIIFFLFLVVNVVARSVLSGAGYTIVVQLDALSLCFLACATSAMYCFSDCFFLIDARFAICYLSSSSFCVVDELELLLLLLRLIKLFMKNLLFIIFIYSEFNSSSVIIV